MYVFSDSYSLCLMPNKIMLCYVMYNIPNCLINQSILFHLKRPDVFVHGSNWSVICFIERQIH